MTSRFLADADVMCESVRSRNTIDIEALILESYGKVALELASLTAWMKGSLYQASSGLIQCRFCPFRAFTNASQVHRNITSYHLGKSFYVCSGKKQQRAIFALYDSDSRSGVQPVELVARSARHIRLVLTGKGATFANVVSIGITRESWCLQHPMVTRWRTPFVLTDAICGKWFRTYSDSTS